MNPLGDYLKARRQLVTPQDAGLGASTGLRRVPGLRREEVATLAGISADYYLRLEQGRDRNPSEPVVAALARVLRLDARATQHLRDLARPPVRAAAARRERVPVGVARLVEVIGLPAFVEGRFFDVLAANALAGALAPGLRVGENRLRSVFCDPAERDLHPDWERALAGLVAGFRASVGTAVDDPRCVSLVAELSAVSERFRRLWARHDVKAREGAPAVLRHPQVGELALRREKLEIPGGDGQMLVIYHAEPGSESARALAMLDKLTG